MKLELFQQIMVLRQLDMTSFMVTCAPGVGLYAAKSSLFTRIPSPSPFSCSSRSKVQSFSTKAIKNDKITLKPRKEVTAMLRIAVCDDTPEELKTVAALTKEYSSAHGLDAEVREFSHPDALLTACETGPFHIYLLDIIMPMLSGLELARSIRRRSTDAQIIFITTERGFALDAYSVNPLHYLLKPVDRPALFAALELAVRKADFGHELRLTLRTKEGLRTLSAGDIACCEYCRHTARYTLVTGEHVETLTLSGSFAEHIAPLLSDRRFIQPHTSFALNMAQVERLDKEGFTLRGGTFVPVSDKQFGAVRSAYMSYRLGEETQ